MLCSDCHRMPAQLFFVTPTHPAAMSTYHTLGDRQYMAYEEKSEREEDFVWDFPSFLFSQPPAFSVFPRKSGALFSNWQRIILPATPQHHTIFLFHWSRPLYYHGKCAFVLWAWNSGKCFWGRYLRSGLWDLKIWHQAKQRGSAQGKKTWFSSVLETV